MARESFVFYRSFYEAMKKLDIEVQAKVYNAIFLYQFEGQEVELDVIPGAIFSLIKPQLDANNNKYENGKLGGAPKGNQNAKKQPKNNLKQPNVNENVNVNDNENEKELNISSFGNDGECQRKSDSPAEQVPNTNDTFNSDMPFGNENEHQRKSGDPVGKVPKTSGSVSNTDELVNAFELLWSSYPRKLGKKKAFLHFKAWVSGSKEYCGKRTKLNNKQMWYAIQNYKLELKKQDMEERFIQHGSTFFNGTIYEYAPSMEEIAEIEAVTNS